MHEAPDTVVSRRGKSLVGGPPSEERYARRCVPPAQRLAVPSLELQHRAELLCRYLAHLPERLSDEQRRGVVVEHEHTPRVDEEHRGREIRRELASEDQRQR